jgi:hypothetical protein
MSLSFWRRLRSSCGIGRHRGSSKTGDPEKRSTTERDLILFLLIVGAAHQVLLEAAVGGSRAPWKRGIALAVDGGAL